jgi:hypothetical protein
MNKSMMVGVALVVGITSSARAEYCEDQFYKEVANVNQEASTLMINNKDAQEEALKRVAAIGLLDKSLNNLLNDSSIPDDEKVKQIKVLNTDKISQQNILDKLTADSRKRTLRITELSKNAPTDLQNKAKECAAKVAPLNLIVNYTVMSLAAYYAPTITGGLIANNPKALYVDMGEVISGNPLGGPTSFPNVVLDQLGKIFNW